MKINCGEIIEALNRGGEETYGKLNDLVECIRQIQEDWKDKNYIEVRVFNNEGNITRTLRKAFPKYDIWWEGDPGYCGENIILVPAADWNDVLKQEIAEFDSAAGHHQETRRDWKLIDGVKLPYDLQAEIDRVKDNLKNAGKSTDEIIIPGYATHQYPWTRCSSAEWKKYFVEVATVIREWNEDLQVNDRRKYAREDEAFKAKTIEI